MSQKEEIRDYTTHIMTDLRRKPHRIAPTMTNTVRNWRRHFPNETKLTHTSERKPASRSTGAEGHFCKTGQRRGAVAPVTTHQRDGGATAATRRKKP